MTLQNERLLVWENPDSAFAVLEHLDTLALTPHERNIYRMEQELARSRTRHTPYYTGAIDAILPELLESGDALAIGEAYYMLGTSSIHTSHYEQSTSYLKQAEQFLIESLNSSPSTVSLSEQLLGVTWFCLGNTSESEMLYQIAHDYYRKAVPLLEKRSNNIFLACAYRDLARTNALSGGDADSTRLWFARATHYAKAAQSDVLATDIDAYYYQYCAPDSIDERLHACRILAEQYNITTRYAEMVEIYLLRGEADSAAMYLERLQPVDSTYSYWFEQTHAYWLSRLSATQHHDSAAYATLRSLYDRTIIRLQRDASARTFTIAQHYDVEREQKRAEQAQREQQWHKRVSAILILTLAITLLLLVLLYLFYRAKRREQATQLQALRDKYVQQLQLALERLQQKVSLTREIEMQRMRGNEVAFPTWLQTYRDEQLTMSKESLNELIDSVDKALDGAISRLRQEYPQLTESDMQFAILSIIGASDNDMSILLNVQKQTIYHRRQIVRKHINEEIGDIDTWLRSYVLRVR
ncbi:MAG: hypothetical protein J6W89_05825 [Paludibacteraceae bacterium]|nr:hypothetical protein [Paludibacteraceae bacterium]